MGADEEIVVRLHPEVPETGEVDDYLTEPNLVKGRAVTLQVLGNQQGQVPSGVQVGPASERVFNVAKRTVENRYSLKSENVEMLIFMKHNSRFLNFRY